MSVARRTQFSLKLMLITVAGAAVGCTITFHLLPELWAWIGEAPAHRKTLFMVLGLVSVFSLIIATGIFFRAVTIATTTLMKRTTDDSSRDE